MNEAGKQIELLQNKLLLAIKALTFYSNETNYELVEETTEEEDMISIDNYTCPILDDYGKLATDTLKEMRGIDANQT